MMKRVALIVAVLGLSAGTAFAATPGTSAMSSARQTRSQAQPAMSQHRIAMAERSDWRANQETRALNLLEAQGFANFTDFRRAGNDQYAANVLQHGRDVTIHVNPQDGQITRG
jgi:hypothetical protein